MNSQRSQRDAVHTSPLQPAVTSSSCQCWICHHYGDSMPCAFCEHSVCEMCVRQCDRCFGVFCAFCSTINYDNHEEHPLCLTCHHEELRWQQNRATQVVQQSGTWERPGMEVYRPLMAQHIIYTLLCNIHVYTTDFLPVLSLKTLIGRVIFVTSNLTSVCTFSILFSIHFLRC